MEIDAKKNAKIDAKVIIDKLIEKIAEIFLPLMNVLSAAGILKGVIAIMMLFGILDESSNVYILMNAITDSLFYFLPIFLACTTAKTVGANPYTAMVIGTILLYPDLTELFAGNEMIHLGVIPIYAVTYRSSIIPIILAVILLSYIEKILNKYIPELIKGFMTPLISILLISFMTLGIFGPFGSLVGDVLSKGYEFIYEWNRGVAGLLLGASIQPMVIFGFHWSFILVAMNNVALNGYDTVLALIAAAVFAQAGAALAVGIKSKDKTFRALCFSAVISACFGVTEPAMFGVNLPRKKPMIAVCVGGGIGGLMAGIAGARASAFAFPNIVTLPIFVGEGFGMLVLGCIVSMVIAFGLTLVMDKGE